MPLGLDKRFVFNILLSMGVSLLLMGILLSGLVGSIHLDLLPKIKAVLHRTSLSLVGSYFIAGVVQAFLRAVRYRIILRASEKEVPGLFHLLLVSMSRNMFVDMLPARLGELSYVAMLNKGFTVRTEACLSSLSISFVFDLIALALLLGMLLIYQLIASKLQPWLIGSLLLVVLASGGLLVFLFPMLSFLGRRLESFQQKGKGIAGRVAGLVRETAAALQQVRASGIVVPLLSLSLGVRVTKYLGLYLLFLGVVLPSYSTIVTNPASVLITLISAEAAASLPVPAFMSFGTYEAGGALTMIALGAEKIASGIILLVLHIWSQIIDYSLGITSLVIFFFVVSRKSIFDGAVRQPQSRRYIIAVLVLLLAGIAFFAFQARKIMKMGSFAAPQPGISVARGKAAAIVPLLQNLHGFVVWSSNRFGNHDIVMLSLPEQKLTRLTTNLHTEYFPRISPDGTRIVFCRSQVPWVSQRNPVPWDVYMLDLKTGKEQLVVRYGNVPTWSEDGKKIRFQRRSNQFVEYNLITGKERVLLETGKQGFLSSSVSLGGPVFSDKRQETAVTLRGSKRATVVVDRQKHIRRVGDGCQLTWAPDSSYLYYVDHGGKMKNAFYKVDPDSLKRVRWFDSPTEYSHEYFPKVANTGNFLVYGASTGAHEHDRADYEIFLWRIGTPAGEAVRLSYHTGNDCWPDIYLRLNAQVRLQQSNK
ncbi:MAG TPA: hypothetical protein ENK84_07190 [Desulfobulbus sp.]|nr:hypothetical protein [Desulfobulbus sp.]